MDEKDKTFLDDHVIIIPVTIPGKTYVSPETEDGATSLSERIAKRDKRPNGLLGESGSDS
jgi:hypothetical protein